MDAKADEGHTAVVQPSSKHQRDDGRKADDDDGRDAEVPNSVGLHVNPV